MDRKKVCSILSIIGVILVIGCAVGDIIVINFCGATPTKVSQSIWCFNIIIWVGIWASANHWVDFYKDAYERLSEAYDELSDQFDKVLKTADEVNKASIKQNKLCEDISKNNKETLAGWQKALDDNKQLCKERHDLLMALAEYEPKHPLIIRFIEEAEKRKAQQQEEHGEVISE